MVLESRLAPMVSARCQRRLQPGGPLGGMSRFQFQEPPNGTVQGVLNLSYPRPGGIVLCGCTAESAARADCDGFACTDTHSIVIGGTYTAAVGHCQQLPAHLVRRLERRRVKKVMRHDSSIEANRRAAACRQFAHQRFAAHLQLGTEAHFLSLMRPFGVKMLHELCKCALQRAFAEKDQLRQAFLFR